jgi:hypothetical protein
MKHRTLLRGGLALSATLAVGEIHSQSMVEVKYAADSAQAGFTQMKLLHGSRSYYIAPSSLFNLQDVDSAGILTGKTTTGQADQALEIYFKTALTDSIRHLTTAALHKRLAIIVDGKLLGAPMVLNPLPSAKLSIPLPTVAETNKLASQINQAIKELHK